jgi:hypothetical protein
VGLDPFGDERDDEIWLPATLVQVYPEQAQVGPDGQPLAPAPGDGSDISDEEATVLGDALIEGDAPAKAGPAFVFGRKNPNFVKEAARVASKDAMLAQLHKLWAAGKHNSKEYRDLVRQFHASETKQERTARLQKFVTHIQQLIAKGVTKGPKSGQPLSTILARAQTYLSSVQAAKADQRREFLGLRRSVETRWVPQLRRDILAALHAQRAAVAGKVRRATPDDIKRNRKRPEYWLADDGRLAKIIKPRSAAIAETVTERASELLQRDKADPFMDRVMSPRRRAGGQAHHGHQRDDPRVPWQRAIADGFDAGLSPTTSRMPSRRCRRSTSTAPR